MTTTRQAQTPWAAAWMLLAVALGSGCEGPPKAPPITMDRFNAALCPRPPREDLSRPLDPTLEGVKADVALVSRTVKSADGVRLTLTFHNAGLHGLSLALPRQAFTLAGWSLVDHACIPVPYAQSTTARALGYGDSGPMPLNAGESATIDSSLTDLAPGLVLKPGIYAIRLTLATAPSSPILRGRTILSDWVTFQVAPQT